MQATVRHFEIPARDFERATRFYAEVFGWRIEPLPWEGPPYARIRAALPATGNPRLGIDGGLTMADSNADQPLLVLHIEGATLDACLHRIVQAGGTVDQPVTRVADFGHFARFRDPEGNLLGLWQSLA